MNSFYFVAGLILSSGLLALAQAPAAHQAAREARPDQRADRTRAFLGLGPAPDPVAAERGAQLYRASCAFCHGPQARGAEGPDLLRSAVVLHDERGEVVGPFLAQGRPDRGMPAFASLSEAQRSDIAAFLHQQVDNVANRGTYKVLNVVTGNAKAGEAYFKSAGGCGGCHSPTGDLAHIGSKFDPAELQAVFLYPGSSNPFEGAAAKPRGPKVTVTLPNGERHSGELKRLDDFTVSLYDEAGNYSSWSRSGGVEVKVDDPLAGHRALLDKYTDADMHNLLAYLVTLK